MDSVIYADSTFTVGRFRCPIDHPSFHDSGPIHDHIFVFPRASVRITHAGREEVVADRTTVMFYNRAQRYRRDPVSPRGDRCDWFRVREDALRDALSEFDPSVCDRRGEPFRFRRGPASAWSFAHSLRVVEYLKREPEPDRLAVEEGVVALLDDVLSAAFRARGDATETSAGRKAHRSLVEATRRTLARSYGEPDSLEDLARRVACSPFHLSRVFRRVTGTTIHGYRTDLRLRAALDQLAGGARDLSALAHDLGFSSHSHFSAVFRRVIGESPSAVRRDLRAGRLGRLHRRVARETA